MAIEVLDTLGFEHGPTPLELAERPRLDKKQQLDADFEWVKAPAIPWVQRRIRGASSGDGVASKRPTLEPIAPLST